MTTNQDAYLKNTSNLITYLRFLIKEEKENQTLNYQYNQLIQSVTKLELYELILDKLIKLNSLENQQKTIN